MPLRIRRITEADAVAGDAYGILVDRLRRRCASREQARLDEWLPEIAPSDWLLEHFGLDPARWGTFRGRYVRQLRAKKRRALLARIAVLARDREVVLLHAARDPHRNPAAVIREVIEKDYPGTAARP